MPEARISADARPVDDALRRAAQTRELSARGFYAEALDSVCAALAREPARLELMRARAAVLYRWGRYRESIDAYRQAEALGELDVVSWIDLGWAQFFTGRLADAETSMRRAVERATDDPSAHLGLAFVLHMQTRHDEALARYQRCLELDAKNFECLTHYGHCLLESGHTAQGEAMLRQAAASAPANPVSWINLSVPLLPQGRDAEVQEVLEQAVRLDEAPGNDAGAFANLAIHFRDTARYDEATALLERHLPRHPDGHAHLAYAFLLLLTGRLPEGWRQHEFRWFSGPMLTHRGRYPGPLWSGQKLNGRTILIVAEQGAGDFIQFVRYVPMVKALGATTLLTSPPAMRSFAETIPGADRVFELGDKLPAFDFYVPLMSLPLAFGTDLDTIPAEIPYLDVDAVRVQRWAPRLASAGSFKVGLAWAGSPMHFQDALRSLPLEALAPLWRVEGVRFFSLQKGAEEAQLVALPGDRRIENLGPDLADYNDTAAVISQLDLLISVDTSVAHLAGALGKPVWLLLPHVPDWRWLVAGEDTRWYPTMRIFRQEARGDWPDVATRVAAALAEQVKSRHSSSVAHSAGASSRPAPVPAPRMRERPDPNSLPGLAAVTETRFGIVQYFPDEPLVGDSIAWYGEYLQHQIDLIGRIVRPGWTVLQVGAGVGLHGLFLAQRLGEEGHLVIYESRQVMRMALTQNLAANRANNVTVMRQKLATVRELGASPTVRGEEAGEREGATPPMTETIDDLRLERLDFLKVDDPALVQTALEASGETLWRLRPLLFLAVSDADALAEVSTRAKDLSYRCWRIESPLFNPDNFNRRENDIFSGQSALALLAIPEEVEVNLALDQYAELG